jgi:hypothetical protein
MTTRRNFLSLGALTAAGLGLATPATYAATPSADPDKLTADQVRQLKPPAKPVIVTRVTGDQSIQEAYQLLLDGTDTLKRHTTSARAARMTRRIIVSVTEGYQMRKASSSLTPAACMDPRDGLARLAAYEISKMFAS